MVADYSKEVRTCAHSRTPGLTGLHQHMESMKPAFEQLVVASTQGQGGKGRNFAESLSKRIDVLEPRFRRLAVQNVDGGSHHQPQGSEVPDDAFSTDLENNDLNRQCYCVLTEKTEGEAFDLVRGVPVQNGAEATSRSFRRQDHWEENAVGSARAQVAGMRTEVGAGVRVQG